MDVAERNQLVERFEGMVIQIARRMHRRRADVRQLGTVDDVIQVGQLGLIRAVEHYNPDHDSKATRLTYCYKVVQKTILRSALESSLIRTPEWTCTQKTHRLGRKSQDAIRQAATARRLRQLSPTWDGPEHKTDHDTPPLEPHEVHDLLRVLPEREAQLLRRYYGLDGGRAHTLREVGAEMGVSGERVRQLLERSLKRLRRKAWALAWALAGEAA